MPKLKPSILLTFCLFWASQLMASASQLDIKLGMSVALTGPASEIGKQLALGSQIYFEQLNKQGGIHGARIQLDVQDDGYEPNHTVNNTRDFIYNKKVHANNYSKCQARFTRNLADGNASCCKISDSWTLLQLDSSFLC